MSGQVVGTGSLNVGGLNGDESAVGVSDETGVTGGISDGGNGLGNGGKAMGGEVSSLGSLHVGGLDGGDGAVGVGDKTAGVVAVPVVVV